MIRRFSFLAVALTALATVCGGGVRGQEAAQEAKPAAPQPQQTFGIDVKSDAGVTGKIMLGAGVNSDAGVTGQIVLDERSFDMAPEILLELALIEFQPEKLHLLEEKNSAWATELEKLWREAAKGDAAKPRSWRVVTKESAARLMQEMRESKSGRIVSTPTLRVVSGREASFHSGGEIPIELPAANGEVKVEYRAVGTHLTATPEYADGRFRIELAWEHSKSMPAEETGAPRIQSRVVRATVELSEGAAAAVVGVGAADGNSSEGQRVLLLLITPQLAEWAPPAPAAPAPLVEIAPKRRPTAPVPSVEIAPVKSLEELDGFLEIMQGTTAVLQAPAAVRRVAGFDEEVVAAAPVAGNLRRIQLRAISEGATTLTITDAGGAEHTLQVLVTGDAREALRAIDRLYPEADVQMTVIGDVAILRGAVAHARDIERIREIVKEVMPDVQLLHQLRVKSWPGVGGTAPAAPRYAPPRPARAPSPPAYAPPLPAAKPLPVPTGYRPNELRELHEEVKLLRRDLNRLIDLLEERLDAAPPASSKKDPSPAGETKDVEARKVPHDSTPNLSGNAHTRNFLVRGSTLDAAASVAQAAARLRSNLADEWLGGPLPSWPEPCVVVLSFSDSSPPAGTTSFIFNNGTPRNMRMTLHGRPGQLETALAHEVMHTVLATHFGRPLPRWADEGIAMLAAGEQEGKGFKDLADFAKYNRLLPLEQLLPLRDYPADVLPAMAQGASLVEFLVERGGKRKLIAFLEDGLESDDWPKALADHYDFADFSELETAWRDAAGLPEQARDAEARKVPPDTSRAASAPGLRINVPAMGPAPVAFDFTLPIADAWGNERMFSFFLGFGR